MDNEQSQKVCCRCGVSKPLSAFSFKDQRRGILHSYCRTCHKAWNRAHYERNRATYIATAHRNSAVYLAESFRNVIAYLREHPCVDCGETDIVVLDFDHRDRSTKRLAVGSLLSRSTWSVIEAEIAKCDVRCANDHRRRTAEQLGWRKLKEALAK